MANQVKKFPAADVVVKSIKFLNSVRFGGITTSVMPVKLDREVPIYQITQAGVLIYFKRTNQFIPWIGIVEMQVESTEEPV